MTVSMPRTVIFRMERLPIPLAIRASAIHPSLLPSWRITGMHSATAMKMSIVMDHHRPQAIKVRV